MPRLSAHDFDPEVMRLFDHYVHGRIDRRSFLEGASRFATRGVTAAMLLEALILTRIQRYRCDPSEPRH